MSAGVPTDDKNWPPFFPIIHHDIANEIPVHAQRLQYLAFASWLGMSMTAFMVSSLIYMFETSIILSLKFSRFLLLLVSIYAWFIHYF